MNKDVEISVVVPCYKCAQSIEELNIRLLKVFESLGIDFEIIYINDCSPDDDWEIIQRLASDNAAVIGVSLSRNFGQHCAITAGIDCCRGRWLVVMDGDLQDRPEEIVKFYAIAQQGYDAVVGIRKERKDSFIKKMSSKLFFIIYNYFTGIHIKNSIGNYGIYSRKVIDSVKRLKEQSRSFGLFVLWVGFRRCEIDIEHAARKYGKTSYTLNKLLALAFESILTHSNKLLRLTVTGGFVISLLSFLAVFLLIFLRVSGLASFPGWTSAVASIYLMGGLVVSAVGVVGVYVGKVFDEVKQRPLYLISEAINLDNWPES